MPESSTRRGRRIESRGRYLIHVLAPVETGLDSACRKLGPAPESSFANQEPDHNHPICQPCLRAAGRSHLSNTSPKPVVVRAAAPTPPVPVEAPPSLQLCHRMVWAAHALGSANRLAIVDALRRAPQKADALRESVGQWEGTFDLGMDALLRGRIVAVSGKRVMLTDLGRNLHQWLAKNCAAGLDSIDPAAPTH